MIKLFEDDEEPESKDENRSLASLNATPEPGPQPVNNAPAPTPSVYDAFSDKAPRAEVPEKVREEPVELRREEFSEAENQFPAPPVHNYSQEAPPSSQADAAAAYTDEPVATLPYQAPTTAETVRSSGLAFNAGIIFFGSVVFMLILGWGADLLLGSSPWGIVGGIILGSLIGFIQFFRISSQIFRK